MSIEPMRKRIAKAVAGEYLARRFDDPSADIDVQNRISVAYRTADRVLAAVGRSEKGRLSRALFLTDEEWWTFELASEWLRSEWEGDGDCVAAFERGREKVGKWMRNGCERSSADGAGTAATTEARMASGGQ